VEGDDTVATDWFGVDMTPLAGGYSGETFAVGSGDDAVVLRIYRRHPDRALVDASLLRLLRGLLDVPAVVDVRPATADSPAILVTERMYGVPLDTVLRKPPRGLDWETLGLELGWILGALSRIPFLDPGFFTDARLTVSAEGMPHDLAEWADFHRRTSRLASWPERDWHALTELVDQAQATLDADSERGPARTVLVHGDFNPKNILVHPEEAVVTGLVDWEYAHAGSIHTDFGNVTRFERDDRLVEPMAEGFVDSAPGHIRDPFGHGRAMDLWALIELAGRTPPHPVADLASRLLVEQARTGDLTTWPWKTARVDPAGAKPVS
jgi:aminoglycoside phosphotransferase (APT) family kinase protein